MKKLFALLLALVMALSLVACGDKTPANDPQQGGSDGDTATYPEYFNGMEDLIAAAQAEGELVVYGSCEEEYLAGACRIVSAASVICAAALLNISFAGV